MSVVQTFTRLHITIIKDFIRLSSSIYREIQIFALSSFHMLVKIYPRLVDFVMDDILMMFDKNNTEQSHIGGLGLFIQNTKQNRMFQVSFLKMKYDIMLKFFQVLIQSNIVENPKISFEKNVSDLFALYNYIEIKKNSSLEFFNDYLKEGKDLDFKVLSPIEIEEFKNLIIKTNEHSTNNYYKLIESIIYILRNQKL